MHDTGTCRVIFGTYAKIFFVSKPNNCDFSKTSTMAAKSQKAVVVAHFDKDHPEDAVQVVEKPIPKPKQGELYVPSREYVFKVKFM